MLSRLVPRVQARRQLGAVARAYCVTSDVSSLISEMKENGVTRGYIVYDDKQKKLRSSHAVFEPIAQFMENDPVDYKSHEAFFFQISPRTGALMSACVYNTTRGQAAGGVRFRPYSNIEEFLRDGMRLAIGM